MSTVSRKEFIRLSSLAFISCLLPVNEIKSFVALAQSPANDFDTAVAKAAEAKVLFFQKKYEAAEAFYRECISLAPGYVQFYDNLDNVLGARGEFIASVYLYKAGLERNPSKIAFYDRLARALMRLELGYRVTAEQYKMEVSSSSLLEDALALYNQALSLAPGTVYLEVGKAKVQYKITIKAPEINFRTSQAQRQARKERSRSFKLMRRSWSAEYLEELLGRIGAKPRNPLYFKHQVDLREKHILKEKKDLLRLIIKRHQANNDQKAALQCVDRLLMLDNQDSLSMNLAKKILYINNKYDDYVAYKREALKNKQHIYGYLGLMDAIEVANSKGSGADLDEAISIGENMLLNRTLPPASVIDIVDKLARIFLAKGTLDKPRLYIERTIMTVDIPSGMYTNKIMYIYAKALIADGSYEECRKMLSLAIYGIKEVNNDIFLRVESLYKNSGNTNLASRLTLYYLLYDTFILLGIPNKAYDVLLEVQAINPMDKFVLKRIQP